MKNNKSQYDSQYTYINGLGFISQTPKQIERKEIVMKYNFLFIALILNHILRNFLTIPVIKWLSAIGLNIGINPITKLVYKDEFSWQITNLMVYIFTMIIPILFLYVVFRKDLKYHYIIKIPNKLSIKYGIIIIVGCALVCNIISFAFSELLKTFGIILWSPNSNYIMQNTPQAMIIYILSLTLIPALLEELLFRGIILNSLRKYGDFIAILVSSTLYALSQSSIQDTLYKFLMGLVIGYFMLRSGSLIVVLLANFIVKSLYMIIWLIQIHNIKYSEVLIISLIIVILILSIIAFSLFILEDKYAFCISNRDTNLKNRNKLKYFISNFGFWILCSIVLFKCISSMQIITY